TSWPFGDQPATAAVAPPAFTLIAVRARAVSERPGKLTRYSPSFARRTTMAAESLSTDCFARPFGFTVARATTTDPSGAFDGTVVVGFVVVRWMVVVDVLVLVEVLVLELVGAVVVPGVVVVCGSGGAVDTAESL